MMPKANEVGYSDGVETSLTAVSWPDAPGRVTLKAGVAESGSQMSASALCREQERACRQGLRRPQHAVIDRIWV
jgi:hypothetical protein